MPQNQKRKDPASTRERKPDNPVRFSELNIQDILDEISSPLNQITKFTFSSMSMYATAPNPYELIDYCQWCGWSDYISKMSPHYETCSWRKLGKCKPTYTQYEMDCARQPKEDRKK
jgi:hypothetical protein